jgi:hypothetical protein
MAEEVEGVVEKVVSVTDRVVFEKYANFLFFVANPRKTARLVRKRILTGPFHRQTPL